MVVVATERCQRSYEPDPTTPLAAALGSALASTRCFDQPILRENAIKPPSAQEKQPHLAASSYLNSAPLIWSFAHGTRKGAVTLIDAVPARCADLLAQGLVEAALVPVIEYQ